MYVALSRVRYINNLIIKSFPYSRIKNLRKSKGMISRINEEKRLRLIQETNLLQLYDIHPHFKIISNI